MGMLKFCTSQSYGRLWPPAVMGVHCLSGCTIGRWWCLGSTTLLWFWCNFKITQVFRLLCLTVSVATWTTYGFYLQIVNSSASRRSVLVLILFSVRHLYLLWWIQQPHYRLAILLTDENRSSNPVRCAKALLSAIGQCSLFKFIFK
jgi:hypothetical protein